MVRHPVSCPPSGCPSRDEAAALADEGLEVPPSPADGQEAAGAVVVREPLDGVPTVGSVRGRVLLLAGALPTLGLPGYRPAHHGAFLPLVVVLDAGVSGGLLPVPRLVRGHASG